MKTILILGATGMLGNAVGSHFQKTTDEHENPKYNVFLTSRDLKFAYGARKNWISYDPTGKTDGAASDVREVFEAMPKNPDYVINCIGAIKPMFAKNEQDSIYINALFPHQLADTCDKLGVKLITISTDCVYSGHTGEYVEASLHDALDAYGKSKSLGEPTKMCQVIRTSIIGDEIKEHASLIAWVKSQAGKTINGFTDHLWNGITTKTYADICDQIISGNLFEKGLFHVHSNNVSKLELLKLINEKFQLGCTVLPVASGHPIDRTLATSKELLSKLSIPTIQEQIKDL